jgi:hypothetical protein
MSKIPTIAEQQLANLQPGKLDEDFMSRLLASTEGSLTELTAEELQFENQLRAFCPRKFSASVDASLVKILNDTPFHVDEKIVLFHRSTSQVGRSATPFRRLNIAAAAAVALLGALTAWITPGQDNETANMPSSGPLNKPAITSPATNAFAPAGFNRNLSDTHDEGVIWNGANRPHRVLRFTYMDRVTLKNEKGELIQVEQPREEYVILPEKID